MQAAWAQGSIVSHRQSIREGGRPMDVLVNGVRLFFDVEGTKRVPDGPVMRETPTLLMLHGGPGYDHSIYRPAYSALADIAQIIYLDHRGNGRSEDGPHESWNLAQWAPWIRSCWARRSAAWSRWPTLPAIRIIPRNSC